MNDIDSPFLVQHLAKERYILQYSVLKIGKIIITILNISADVTLWKNHRAETGENYIFSQRMSYMNKKDFIAMRSLLNIEKFHYMKYKRDLV